MKKKKKSKTGKVTAADVFDDEADAPASVMEAARRKREKKAKKKAAAPAGAASAPATSAIEEDYDFSADFSY